MAGCGSSADESASTDSSTPSTALPDSVNTLTDAERQNGWQLLFDGQSLDGWRGFKRDSVPDGWTVANGAMHFVGTASSQDGAPPLTLITDSTFANFDLRFEWKIAAEGNSGVMYRVSEQEDLPYETGPEYQILDNSTTEDSVHKSGALYGLYAPSTDMTRPIGTYNEARIVVRGAHMEHWLNGTKLLEAEIGSDTWTERVAGTKFANWPNFAQMNEGHIALQDHGHPVWVRDVKIQPLSPTARL
jgi:hypothetical protein